MLLLKLIFCITIIIWPNWGDAVLRASAMGGWGPVITNYNFHTLKCAIDRGIKQKLKLICITRFQTAQRKSNYLNNNSSQIRSLCACVKRACATPRIPHSYAPNAKRRPSSLAISNAIMWQPDWWWPQSGYGWSEENGISQTRHSANQMSFINSAAANQYTNTSLFWFFPRKIKPFVILYRRWLNPNRSGMMRHRKRVSSNMHVIQ